LDQGTMTAKINPLWDVTRPVSTTLAPDPTPHPWIDPLTHGVCYHVYPQS